MTPQVSAYDTTKSLVIDPTLSYSTYLGNEGDFGYGIAVDAGGNAYVTGSAPPLNFPTTTGAFQTTASGSFSEAFVTKLDPTGSALAYSTYLGGSNEDGGYKIAVDPAGNAYLTGYTDSTDFPTTIGAFQPVRRSLNSHNAFVTKLNPTGSALVYSTYLGGSGSDGGRDIALDAAGNAYMTGFTHSNDFPTTASAFQPVKTGLSISNGNAFVTKLNADGTALLYSTYLGGSETAPSPQMQPMNGDQGNGIAVDSAGNAYIAGTTCSSDFPTTLLAFQMVYQGSCDAFVTKIDPTGLGPTSLVYSTFLGGISGEVAYGIALDAENNVYATGVTCSPNFPVTPLAFQIVPQGSCDAFVTKLSPTAGSGLVYSTFLGGTRGDNTSGIAVDSAGNAYVTGATNSTDFPVTPDAFQASKAGDAGTWDAILTVLNPSGSAPLYSTHLGGGTPPDPGASSNSAGTHLALDTNGNVYLTGWTYSISFPTTPGAFQTVNKSLFGEANAFVAKFSGFQTAQ